ncbi:hypothetical protein SV7mr_02670 [Stieleria bergensis]|uniref:DUF3299 domain-containing protein n=1 Tax=Stieleria bergensis TaxID=2528025 RepID=A0A517SNT8_9BACT|nr:hypothetical protein SV7mr_02670 [Planctomycetes bacterium SV_7m_r]
MASPLLSSRPARLIITAVTSSLALLAAFILWNLAPADALENALENAVRQDEDSTPKRADLSETITQGKAQVAKRDQATRPQSALSPRDRFAQNSDKPTVEFRPSSEAQLAKGEINFDDLKFDIEKDSAFNSSMWTKRLKRINDKNVKLRGYMLPSSIFQSSGIKQFVLVRDNQECCFGPGALLFDCVFVEMTGDATAKFTTRPVTVEGTFLLDDEKYRYPEGTGPGTATHMAVFRIEASSVK